MMRIESEMMRIESKMLRVESRVGEIFSKFLPVQKKAELPKLFPNEIYAHKKLFDYYGISCDDVNSKPANGITEVITRDGPLCIYWDKRTIVAPIKYYSSQK